MLKRLWQRINPFHKTIKIIYNGAEITRHGNCYDIALPCDFKPEYRHYTSTIGFDEIDLGIQTTLPKYYRAVLNFRSSTPKRYRYINASGFGEIEWDYSGRWVGTIASASSSIGMAFKGDRLFQFHIEPLWDAPWYVKVCHLFAKFSFVEVEELTTTRGGLGSTGR